VQRELAEMRLTGAEVDLIYCGRLAVALGIGGRGDVVAALDALMAAIAGQKAFAAAPEPDPWPHPLHMAASERVDAAAGHARGLVLDALAVFMGVPV
jgi:hypothetical protein